MGNMLNSQWMNIFTFGLARDTSNSRFIWGAKFDFFTSNDEQPLQWPWDCCLEPGSTFPLLLLTCRILKKMCSQVTLLDKCQRAPVTPSADLRSRLKTEILRAPLCHGRYVQVVHMEWELVSWPLVHYRGSIDYVHKGYRVGTTSNVVLCCSSTRDPGYFLKLKIYFLIAEISEFLISLFQNVNYKEIKSTNI